MASVALCRSFWAAQSSAEMQKSVVTDWVCSPQAHGGRQASRV